jgi:hypothetical protein
MHDNFDYDDVHVELGNLAESWPVVSSIVMSSWPFAFKIIAMPNDLDKEIEIAWEVLKAQLMLKKKHGSFTVGCFTCSIFLWWMMVVTNCLKKEVKKTRRQNEKDYEVNIL